MTKLDSISTFFIDLSTSRDRLEMPINASYIWVAYPSSTNPQSGFASIGLNSYTSSDTLNLTAGFYIESYIRIDKIYISNKAQPDKTLELNYSNTIRLVT